MRKIGGLEKILGRKKIDDSGCEGYSESVDGRVSDSGGQGMVGTIGHGQGIGNGDRVWVMVGTIGGGMGYGLGDGQGMGNGDRGDWGSASGTKFM